MGQYLILIGACINCFYCICNRFIWKMPNWLAIPVLILGIALILIGSVWGRPISEALLILGICVGIIILGIFLAWKFLK